MYNARYYDDYNILTYENIIDHRKASGGNYVVQALWDTGEEIWEPMKTIIEYDKITLAKYAKERGLLNTPG